tara:strand:+ start:349 stop:1332 length:984 start_codon:yes stop_codon:yes gene_type:complete
MIIPYNWLLILILINLVSFIIYFKTAKKFGFVDNSKKFKNPKTVTSAGLVIYLNFCISFIGVLIIDEKNIINFPNNYLYSFISLSTLVFISALDDKNPIDPKIRLFFQLVCIYISLTSISLYELNIPLKVSIGICLLIWVYILNITNFTDGSDGFLVTNSIFVFSNIILLNYLNEINIFSNYLGIIILPSLFIFLFFNKPTAKMYLGDSGSILIGYLNGFLFLELLILYKFNLAISLLIYPIIDCTIALIKKTFAGKLPWTDTSNYSFLQPTIKKNQNKYFVFYINLLFNLLNSLLIFVQIKFGWYYIFINVILTLITMKIYEKKIN